MANVDVNIEKWKKRLLDLGKKNRLINYRETKRSNIKITSPNSAELYSKLVINEKVYPQMTPDAMKIVIDELIKKEKGESIHGIVAFEKCSGCR